MHSLRENSDNYTNITILSRPVVPVVTESSPHVSAGRQPNASKPALNTSNTSNTCIANQHINHPNLSQPPQPPQPQQASQATHSAQPQPQYVGSDQIGSNTECAVEDKSPMCQINEICRYNNIKQEYLLIEELGPPHDKTFTGSSEEYRGSGPSIKKAQRSAATSALLRTQLKHPTPRAVKNGDKNVWPLTPTVELNVLAMKLGQNAVYEVYEPPPQQTPTYSFGAIGSAPITATNAYDFRGMHYQRYRVPRGLYSATLTIGAKQFTGKGRTAQAARHSAADEALKVLRETTLPSHQLTSVSLNESEGTSADTSAHTLADNSIKSPISVVHEMALHRNLMVRFEVIDESGPSHLPVFVTQCTVGEIVTKGEGNCKRVSKTCSALRMIEELRKLVPISPPIPQTSHPLDPNTETQHNDNKTTFTANNGNRSDARKNNNNEKSEELSVECVSSDGLGNGNEENEGNDGCNGIHPINRLIQLQQARKEKEPQFTLLSERCLDRRRREFTIECVVNVSKGSNAPQMVSAVGLGPNKKLAKKNAAEAILQVLGYSSRPQPQSILKQDSAEGQSSALHHKKIRQVKFVEDDGNCGTGLADMTCIHSAPKLGRQLVPGLILMPTTDTSVHRNFNKPHDTSDPNSLTHSKETTGNSNGKKNLEEMSNQVKCIRNLAKELLGMNAMNGCQIEELNEDNRVDQLKSLSQAMGCHVFQVHFSDFPKKQTNNQSIEYLSVVTITTLWSERPIVSHGNGVSQEVARNQASHQALIALSQLDLTQFT
ncbi:unnamed protein product [Medioppia subpectinata]|uniref:DRBM domain-containing protein n=1 Tax=Medioppia subpectinata TaxID=1979941 RepID=A0A7R9Q2K0_9ACAR|nr:unnamed protein product [Medioppia subpectinata]CAG2110460.1 unnamed protein product [Medioppia subpectinata]